MTRKTPDQELVDARKEAEMWKTKYNRMATAWLENDENSRELWEAARTGKKRKFIPDTTTLTKIRDLASLNCSQREIASLLGLDEGYFGDLKRQYPEVAAALDIGQDIGKVRLRRKQFEQAEESVQMSIHLGKHILDQTDRIKQEITGNMSLLQALMELPDEREVIDTIESPEKVFTAIPNDNLTAKDIVDRIKAKGKV